MHTPPDPIDVVKSFGIGLVMGLIFVLWLYSV